MTPDLALAPDRARELRDEIARRAAALSSLGAYREYMASTGLPDLMHPHAAHHRIVAHAIDRLLRRQIKRLMVIMPPGAAKTTVAHIQAVTYALARDPSEQVLAVSHSEELAEALARRKRTIMQSPEWQRLAGAELAADQQALGRMATTRHGGHMAAGMGSAIAGFRASLGVIDDPIKGWDQAMNPALLAKQVAWFDTDYRPRLLPNAAELVVTTRWADADLAGELIRRHESGREEWVILRMPMLADSTDDPLGRSYGAPLWDWYTETQVREAQRDALVWSALYQGAPLDTAGSWVNAELIQYLDAEPPRLTKFSALDLALTVGAGDYTAQVAAGIDMHGSLVICDVWRDRIAPNEVVTRVLDTCARHGLHELDADDDNATKVFAATFGDVCRSQGRSPVHLSRRPMRGQSKEVRNAALRALFHARRVYLVRGPWNAEFVREVLTFPGGANDDMVDAAGLCARRHAQMSPPAAPTKPASAYDGWLYDPNRTDDQGRLLMSCNLDEMFEHNERDSHRRARLA